MPRFTLPSIAAPNLEAWPAPVATWQHTGPSGQVQAFIDLIRGIGRPGAIPSLALSYTAGGARGPFGLGWSLNLPAIIRGNGRHLPRYADAGPDADPYTASDIGELIPVLTRQGGRWLPDCRISDGYEIMRFRARNESAFARIERYTHLETGEIHWQIISRENVRRIYGQTPDHRIADPAAPQRVAQWLLQAQWDSHGHGIHFRYKREEMAGVTPTDLAEQHRIGAGRPEPQLHLKSVHWANARPFVPEGWLFELLFDYGEHVDDEGAPAYAERRPWALRLDAFSSYRLGFELRTRRLCQRALLFSHLSGQPRLLRAHTFAYESTPVAAHMIGVTVSHYRTDETGRRQEAPLPTARFSYSAALPPSPARAVETADGDELALAGEHQWLDLECTGLPGLVSRGQGGALYYRRNLGAGRLGPTVPLPVRPSLADSATPFSQSLGKPFGDSRSCLIDMATGPGYQERTREGAWLPYTPFQAAPTVRMGTTGLRSLDLNGDGRADLLLADEHGPRYHPFAGRAGWAPARAAAVSPHTSAALYDQTGTVMLADMTGDGLADLVQVLPGSVRYWPNLGHGRFGAPVQMAGAPLFDGPDLFDPVRVRLVDIDGTGAADLLYLGRERVVWYANQSGNRFGPPCTIDHLPVLTNLDAIAVVDLLGTGTGCLVYTSAAPSRSARYVELVGGQQPHLLTAIENGQGVEVAITYTPSTRLMLRDAEAGRPWQTTLPTPVWLVTEMRQTDHIAATTHVTTWSYRHGYYDDAAREMRGFASVERREIELAAHAAAPTEPLAGAPHVVRTWYHTGALVERLPLEARLVAEFFDGDPAQPTSPDIAIENPIGIAQSELLRSLQGRPLREEIYGLDEGAALSGALARCPYAVKEYGYLVRALQPPGPSTPPAVALFAHEEIVSTYERQADDPRQQQQLTLAIDALGSPTCVIEIAYPRRRPEHPAQRETLATLTERTVYNSDEAPDRYRAGLPIAERRYAISALPPLSPGIRYRAEELAEWLGAGGPLQRQLLSATEVRYCNDALTAAAPPGTAGAHALLHHRRRAAFTPELLAAVYGANLPDAPTLTALGYEYEHDLWWALESQTSYDATHFYQPVLERTALGAEQRIRYDSHSLFVTEVCDPVGNVTSATYDDQALAVASITEINGTIMHVAFDRLGLPRSLTLTGVHGEGGMPAVAVARDPLAWQRERSPMALRIASSTQPDDPAAPLERQTIYLDGQGRPLQRKRLAEPAPGEAAVRWVVEPQEIRTAAGHSLCTYGPWFTPDESFTPPAAAPKLIRQLDALSRTVAERRADGALSRQVWRAWQLERWDANDTVRESDWLRQRQRPEATADDTAAATAALSHAGTPTVDLLDPAGRPCAHIEDGGEAGRAITHVVRAPGGEISSVTDARALLTEQRTYDLLGHTLLMRSAASGQTRTLYDATGEPVYRYGARGQAQRLVRDDLGRLLRREVRAPGGRWRVAERLVWGEEAPPGDYRRGKLYLHYDGAGQVKHLAYDYRGNLLRTERRLRADLAVPADWANLESAAPAEGESLATAVERLAAPALTAEALTTATAYDALDRPALRTAPDGSQIALHYGPRGLAAAIELTTAGRSIAVLQAPLYDAAGRRCDATLGNGVRERAIYNEATDLLSRRTTQAPNGAVLRDLQMQHDAVGNLLRIADGGQQTLYFGGVAVSPDRTYRYDARYRLIEASGREAISSPPPTGLSSDEIAQRPLPHPNDRMAVRRYTERYQYDLSNNLLQITHLAPLEGSWSRRYTIAAESDRVININNSDGLPLQPPLRYDDGGNAISLGGLAELAWDDDERLEQVDLGGGGTAYYRYDGAGRRTVKLIIRQGGEREVRVYLDTFEQFWRERATGERIEEATALHVSDGEGRLLLVEQQREAGALRPTVLWRYQHADQVGSCWLETDLTGELLTCEEFLPFGATAYRAGPPLSLPKRYRFAGQERDNETGLQHHGARQYAPWLCRWISPDPAGMADGTNRYAYARNNPVALSDPTGTQSVGHANPQPPLLSIPEPFRNPNYHINWSMHTDAAGNRTESLSIYPAWCVPPECHSPPLYQARAESRVSVARAPHRHRTPTHRRGHSQAGTPPAVRTAPPPVQTAAPVVPPVAAQSTPPAAPARPASAGPAASRPGFWSSGGDLVVLGSVATIVGAAVLLGSNPLGWAALLMAGSAVVSGSASISFGAVELLTAHSRTPQQEERFHEVGITMGALLTPGGAIGGALGGAITGNTEGLAIGAQVGALVEGVYALGRGAVSLIRAGTRLVRGLRTAPSLVSHFTGAEASVRVNPINTPGQDYLCVGNTAAYHASQALEPFAPSGVQLGETPGLIGGGQPRVTVQNILDLIGRHTRFVAEHGGIGSDTSRNPALRFRHDADYFTRALNALYEEGRFPYQVQLESAMLESPRLPGGIPIRQLVGSSLHLLPEGDYLIMIPRTLEESHAIHGQVRRFSFGTFRHFFDASTWLYHLPDANIDYQIFRIIPVRP